MRREAIALLAMLVLLVSAAAGSAAGAPVIANRHELAVLYQHDHRGSSPASDVALQPYGVQFEKILASCTINSENLMNDTLWWSGQASLAGAPRVTNLGMIQAIAYNITWKDRRSCWDMFDRVEHGVAVKTATSMIKNRHEVTALYVIDNQGIHPADDTALLPYAIAFAKIMSSCTVDSDDLTNGMIEDAAKAGELGGRHVSSLQMLQAVARRITWTSPKRDCYTLFDVAEAHMENGGP